MYNLVVKLCELFGCSTTSLARKLSHHDERKNVHDFLTNFDVFVTTDNVNYRHIKFTLVTVNSSKELTTTDESFPINLFFYAKYHIKLVYPFLPCIAEEKGFRKRPYYFPMELVYVVPKISSTCHECYKKQKPNFSIDGDLFKSIAIGSFKPSPHFPSHHKSGNCL
jgi:hypothetical protein